MAFIKIIDENNMKTTCNLLSYSTFPSEEGLLLEIYIPNACLKYQLFTDMHNPQVDKMELMINTLFDNVLLNNQMIYLEENFSLQYMLLGDNTEPSRSFTAKKL